ncbi:MAG: hypothetical protein ACOYEG_12720 [Petrimonas sp.]|jgi:preprotein translocase subunit Sss1|nr:MAG: hypothetical protein BWZ00_01239 [Bacteroidetes bacterium ADurb.BinA174]
MKNVKQIFHLLSYLQYPFLLIGLFLLIKPFFRGFDYVSSNPEFLFKTYNNVLIFFGLTLSFASLQDSTKTSLRYEKQMWQNPKKAKFIFIVTIVTMIIFFISGMLGFIIKENAFKEFSYGSLILAIGLLGYLKLQMEIYENHKKIKKE